MLRWNLGCKWTLGDFTKGRKFLWRERVAWVRYHGDIMPRMAGAFKGALRAEPNCTTTDPISCLFAAIARPGRIRTLPLTLAFVVQHEADYEQGHTYAH